MKKGYSVENCIDYTDFFISVFNFNDENEILNLSTQFICQESKNEDYYIGVWKIKKLK